MIRRTDANTKKFSVNGVNRGSIPTASTSLPNQELWLLRSGGTYSTEQVPCAFLGALTDAQEVTLANALMAYHQTMMLPIFFWGDSQSSDQGAGGSNRPVPWPATIGANLGRLAWNGGVQGETANQIRARMVSEKFGAKGTTVIWAGRNDMPANPASVKSSIAAMVANLETTRFVIIGQVNGDYTTEYAGQSGYAAIVQLNADLAALYPNNFLDIRTTLVAQGAPGAPFADPPYYARDCPPAPGILLPGEVHFSDAGSALIGQTVQAFITSKGW